MRRRPSRETTLLRAHVDGVECRLARYDIDRHQVMLTWNEETIKTTVVNDCANALVTVALWRLARDARAAVTVGAPARTS